MWEELHPADRVTVSKSIYVRCQEAAGAPATLIRLAPAGLASTSIDRPGVSQRTVPTVVLSQKVRDASEKVHTILAYTAILRSDGRPRWLLDTDEYRAYVDGRCPRYAYFGKSQSSDGSEQGASGESVHP
jgi:hypothetical protein